jgi:Rrf2 family protein
MLLSQTVQYALRAMTYMANLPQGQSVRGRDLAQATGIPTHYLAKLLRRLVEAGLLASQKGHGGGFTLAMHPRFVRMLDVMLAADFRPAQNQCAFGWGACQPAAPCPLHPLWSQLNDTVCDWAAQATLADVMVPGGLPLPDVHCQPAALREFLAQLRAATLDEAP